MHCIDILLDTIAKNSVTDDTSSSVLAACGLISSQHNGQKSSQVVYKMLELKILTVKAVNAGTVALIAARRRADYKQAELSTKQIDGLMVKLLISALHSNENSVEMIYNLGRQFLDAPKAGLFFYNEILKVDPTYDERWYYHRDLGLIYYSINMYEKAAFHYDKSSKLKSNYSELFRFAGDAYYYQGKWYEALIRYEKSTVL